MILLIDTVRGPNEHMTLNTSILKSLDTNNEEISFMTTFDYWRSFDGDLRSGINHYEVKRLNHGPVNTIKTLLLTFKILVLNNKYECVIFLSSLTYNSLFCALLQKLGLCKKKLIIFLHETSYLDISKSFSIKIASRALSMALKMGLNKKSYFIIIGDYIKKELYKKINLSKNSLIALDHPLDVSEVYTIKRPNRPLKLASIGVQNKEKNADYFLDLAKISKKSILKQEVVFSTIGRLEIDFDHLDIVQHYSLNYDDYLIPFEIYEELILEQDYLLFFYGEAYNLKTSGCLLDAIKYQKPLIALHSNITNYYLEKYGDIGYLCNSLEEMNSLIESLTKNRNEDEYLEMVQKIKQVKDSLNIDSFKKELNEIIGY